MRESATQMQTEIDRKQEHISTARNEIQKIKNQLTQMDISSPNYVSCSVVFLVIKVIILFIYKNMKF